MPASVSSGWRRTRSQHHSSGIPTLIKPSALDFLPDQRLSGAVRGNNMVRHDSIRRNSLACSSPARRRHQFRLWVRRRYQSPVRVRSRMGTGSHHLGKDRGSRMPAAGTPPAAAVRRKPGPVPKPPTAASRLRSTIVVVSCYFTGLHYCLGSVPRIVLNLAQDYTHPPTHEPNRLTAAKPSKCSTLLAPG